MVPLSSSFSSFFVQSFPANGTQLRFAMKRKMLYPLKVFAFGEHKHV